VALGRLGGLQISDLPVTAYLNLMDSCRLLTKVPLMIGTAEQSLMNNQFSDLIHLPDSRSLRQMAGDSLLETIDQLFIQQARALGINWRQSTKNLSAPIIYTFNQNGILNFETVQTEDITRSDANEWRFSASFVAATTPLIKAGLPGMHLPAELLKKGMVPDQLLQKLRQELAFEGLLLSDWDSEITPQQLNSGVDLFLVKKAPMEALFSLQRAYKNGLLTDKVLDQKVRKILLAKNWIQKSRENLFRANGPHLLALQASIQPFQTEHEQNSKILDRSELKDHFNSPKWELFRHRLYEESIILANNPRGQIPFTKLGNFTIWEFSERPLRSFRKAFKKFADFNIQRLAEWPDQLPAIALSQGNVHIILLDHYQLDSQKDKDFLQSIQSPTKGTQLVIVNYGPLSNLPLLPAHAGVVQMYERNEVTESLGAQLLFGAFQARGQLPEEWKQQVDFLAPTSIPIRLKYGIPQEVGIDPARLVGIDAIARNAIQEGVMPGCQVLVAKEGKIIYNKAFGHHTYRKNQSIQPDDLYDLASITKVGATTLALMQLYEEQKIGLNTPLKEVLPLPETSELRPISIKRLMTHQSGLQIYMPVAPYLLFRDRPNAECDSFFCKNPTDTFAVQIADNFYFKKEYQEKIWQDVVELPLYKRKRTRYSDVNFYLLQKVIEEQTAQRLDQLVAQKFYQPLGLRYMTFNPARKFNKKRLVPTELDKRWRQQLVRGYVHDETAALLGGVAGHAGLFGTAEDLAVVFQMLLNGGHYGGRQYLAAQTIELFTSRQYGTSRGLGFDKPSSKNQKAVAEDASPNTFGHTGFTGTCVWADPDEELIFIFLSNRVYPVARNPLLNKFEVRRRMHQVVYDALDSFTEMELTF
jgi:beta-N-acetylhexosaminidase